MPRRRSIGITVYCIIAAILSLLWCVFGPLADVLGELHVMSGLAKRDPMVVDYKCLFKGIIFSTGYLFYFISSIGSLFLKNWARRSLVLMSLLSIVLFQFSLCDGFTSIEYLLLFNLVINIVIVYYFTRPKVKAQFSPERGKAESKEAV